MLLPLLHNTAAAAAPWSAPRSSPSLSPLLCPVAHYASTSPSAPPHARPFAARSCTNSLQFAPLPTAQLVELTSRAHLRSATRSRPRELSRHLPLFAEVRSSPRAPAGGAVTASSRPTFSVWRRSAGASAKSSCGRQCNAVRPPPSRAAPAEPCRRRRQRNDGASAPGSRRAAGRGEHTGPQQTLGSQTARLGTPRAAEALDRASSTTAGQQACSVQRAAVAPARLGTPNAATGGPSALRTAAVPPPARSRHRVACVRACRRSS